MTAPLRVLKMQNSAPNSKKCSKGAQRNRERPTSDAGPLSLSSVSLPPSPLIKHQVELHLHANPLDLILPRLLRRFWEVTRETSVSTENNNVLVPRQKKSLRANLVASGIPICCYFSSNKSTCFVFVLNRIGVSIPQRLTYTQILVEYPCRAVHCRGPHSQSTPEPELTGNFIRNNKFLLLKRNLS